MIETDLNTMTMQTCARLKHTAVLVITALTLAIVSLPASSNRELEVELIANPSGRVPLAAALSFTGGPGIRTHIKISDGTNHWSASFGDEIRSGDQYVVPVVGMRADRKHKILLSLAGENLSLHREFTHRTPSLSIDPQETPPIDIMISDTERMEPGVLFLSIRRRALGRPHWHSPKQRDFSMNWGRLVALDPKGEIIWFFESEFRTAGIDRLRNGNILMHRTDSSTLEIDLLGNVVRQYYAEDRPDPAPDNPNAIPIQGQQTLHHQPHVLPNGNLLAFSANGYLIENWHSSETDLSAPRKDQMVMADSVVEISPTGEKVWSWNSMDYLDTERIGYDTFWSYWWVRNFPEHMDWTHGNGLSWDATDNSILVSFRNQSAIVKIDYATKEIKWILGRHEGWPERLQNKLLEPIGDLLWPGYQHNPRVTHVGTIIFLTIGHTVGPYLAKPHHLT